jgi:hypothetical protein
MRALRACRHECEEKPMPTYLISFPSGVMDFREDEFPTVVEESHAVVRDMRAAGVLVYAGGIDEGVAAVRVAGDGSITESTYPQTSGLTGGVTVINVATRDEAVEWAARTAAACRCDQELRAFGVDPQDDGIGGR